MNLVEIENKKKNSLSRWEKILKNHFSSKKMMLNLIKYPVITEKSYISLLKNKQYTFDVDVRMTKTQMKNLFEDLFLVKIQSLNTHRPPRKRTRSLMGFKSRYKRVIITIKDDQVFNFNIKP